MSKFLILILIGISTATDCKDSFSEEPPETGKQPDEDTWDCPKCTYKNRMASIKCQICDLGTDELPMLKKSMRFVEKWDCKTCTFKNEMSSYKCEMCGKIRTSGCGLELALKRSRSMIQYNQEVFDYDLEYALKQSEKDQYKPRNDAMEFQSNVLNHGPRQMQFGKDFLKTSQLINNEEEWTLTESKESRNKNIGDLVTVARPLKQFGWTNENIQNLLAQNYNAERDGSKKN